MSWPGHVCRELEAKGMWRRNPRTQRWSQYPKEKAQPKPPRLLLPQGCSVAEDPGCIADGMSAQPSLTAL